MFVTKMKPVAVRVLALGIVISGTGGFSSPLLATAPAPKKTDNEKIQGTWAVVSAEADGKKLPPREVKDVTLVITADQIVFNLKGEEKKAGNYKLAPTKSPKVIELTPLDGPDKGKPQRDIYELNGDQLKLCIQNGDGQPPTEFATKAGDGLSLLILKRVKK